MAIVDIANAMAQIEGWNVPNSLAQRNNNPLNLRFVGQPGATLGKGGFAKFTSADAGFQAGENQISLDASRGLDVASFINKFAPPSENNTSNYISMFTSMLGVNASDKLSSLISSDGVVSAANSSDSILPASASDIIDSLGLTQLELDPTTLGIAAAIVIGGLVIYSATS